MNRPSFATAILLILVPAASFAFATNKCFRTVTTIGKDSLNAVKPFRYDTVYNSTVKSSKSLSLNDEVAKAIDEAKANYNFSSKNLIITKTSVSNAGKSAAELEVFLINKGYKLLACGGVSMPLKGFKIVKHTNCFEIILGTI